MDIETFCSLPDSEVARIVAEHGPHTLVCPINGTRRWYHLEFPDRTDPLAANYLDEIGRKYIEIFKLFFDHGIHTILSPIFGPDLLARDAEYVSMAAEGLGRIVSNQNFLQFYETYSIRAFVYGDYEHYLAAPAFRHLTGLSTKLKNLTKKGQNKRLFWGMFAQDATETVIQYAIDFHQKYGRAPTRSETIAAYYGESVHNVDIFIGFDKFSAFDMPLITDGTEDLYFLASPTPYLTRTMLRHILFDHLYLRPVDSEFQQLSLDGISYMRTYYQQHRSTIFGIGNLVHGVWYPSGNDANITGTRRP